MNDSCYTCGANLETNKCKYCGNTYRFVGGKHKLITDNENIKLTTAKILLSTLAFYPLFITLTKKR